MAEEQGPEPTGWELMRGIARIEQAVKDSASTYLPIQLFISEKKQLTDREDSLGKEIATIRGDLKTANDRSLVNEQRLDDQRGRNRLFLYGLVGGPVITGVLIWIINGGLTTP